MEDSRADTAAGRARRTAPAVDGRFDRLALDVSKEFGLPLRALFHNEPFIDVRVARRRLAARAAGAGIRTSYIAERLGISHTAASRMLDRIRTEEDAIEATHRVNTRHRVAKG